MKLSILSLATTLAAAAVSSQAAGFSRGRAQQTHAGGFHAKSFSSRGFSGRLTQNGLSGFHALRGQSAFAPRGLGKSLGSSSSAPQGTISSASSPPGQQSAPYGFVGTGMNTLVETPGDARSYVYQGGAVAFTPTLQQYATNAPALFVGPADLAPGQNTGQSASGGNSITPNGSFAP